MIRDLFFRLGEILADLFMGLEEGKHPSQVSEELLSLSMGRKRAVRDYYVKKFSTLALILTIGIILSGVYLFISRNMSRDEIMKILQRPAYGEGDRQEHLSVQIGDEQQEISFTVQEQKLTTEEKQEYLNEAMAILQESVLGENKSADEIRSDLYMPANLCDGNVQITWKREPADVIRGDGTLLELEDEDGTFVDIEAVLDCQGQEAFYRFSVEAYPRILTPEEELTKQIKKLLTDADEKDAYGQTMTLPDSVGEEKLIWTKKKSSYGGLLPILTLVLIIFFYSNMDSKIHDQAEYRKNQLMMDYPDFMWKMTMLLGAGLSIKGCFNRISTEYQREKKAAAAAGRNFKERYVYEEITYACLEMESGISEASAYERFGKRCQLPEYMRLGSVLSQNLKKGAKGLTELLSREAESSLTDRKNHAKQIGEKAGTKLLIPMMLMLVVAMAILLVPAFLSFQ